MVSSIENEYLKIAVKHKGAELCSMFDKEDGIEHLWQADPNVWGKHSPILFPAVGMSKNGTYSFKGQEYKMPKHGFARDYEFELAAQGENFLTFRLSANEETKAMFPFDFELDLKYVLKGKKLSFVYTVRNKGQEEMYFGLGGHPAFATPFTAEEELEDYELAFSKEETQDLIKIDLSNGLLSGELEKDYLKGEKRIPITKQLFDADALVFENLTSEYIAIKPKKGGKELRVSLEGWQYLGIWAMPAANYVCIEPWCGIADESDADGEFTTKRGNQRLDAGAEWERRFEVSLV